MLLLAKTQEPRPRLRRDKQSAGAGSHLTVRVTAGVVFGGGGLISLI